MGKNTAETERKVVQMDVDLDMLQNWGHPQVVHDAIEKARAEQVKRECIRIAQLRKLNK
jgi:hypothetical protein